MYKVLLTRHAERDLRRLPAEVFQRIVRQLKNLSQVPRPHGCRKLTDVGNDYRIRVGEYRVLYEIDDGTRQVKILRAGHRRDVYR
jgi:mRNA interferase RelE/StbE